MALLKIDLPLQMVRYLWPLVLTGLLVGVGILVSALYAPSVFDKLNSRAVAVVLGCIGTYVGTVLVFENVTEAFKVSVEAKDQAKVQIASKSIGGIVIILSLLMVTAVALVEARSSQEITCGSNKWTLDKFVRSDQLYKALQELCGEPRGVPKPN